MSIAVACRPHQASTIRKPAEFDRNQLKRSSPCTAANLYFTKRVIKFDWSAPSTTKLFVLRFNTTSSVLVQGKSLSVVGWMLSALAAIEKCHCVSYVKQLTVRIRCTSGQLKIKCSEIQLFDLLEGMTLIVASIPLTISLSFWTTLFLLSKVTSIVHSSQSSLLEPPWRLSIVFEALYRRTLCVPSLKDIYLKSLLLSISVLLATHALNSPCCGSATHSITVSSPYSTFTKLPFVTKCSPWSNRARSQARYSYQWRNREMLSHIR